MALTLLMGLSVMVFDGLNALLFDLGLPHAYAPDLRVRLATGVLAGIAMAFALVPTLAQIEGRTSGMSSFRPLNSFFKLHFKYISLSGFRSTAHFCMSGMR